MAGRPIAGIIVGVAGDVRQAKLDRPAVPEVYQVVSAERRRGGPRPDVGEGANVAPSIAPAVRAAAREINPAVAIFNVKTMEHVIADSLWELNLYR